GAGGFWTCGSGTGLAAEKDVHRRQGEGEPSRVPGIELLEHDVDLEKISKGIYQGQKQRNGIRELALLRLAGYQWRHREDGEEQGGEAGRQAQLAAVVKTNVPADVEQQGSGITQDQQAPPGLEDHQCKRAQIQNGDVGEQRYFPVLAGGKQQRSSEAANQGKCRED